MNSPFELSRGHRANRRSGLQIEHAPRRVEQSIVQRALRAALRFSVAENGKLSSMFAKVGAIELCGKLHTRIGRLTGILAPVALALAACSHDTRPGYQGYVEGDYVYVASPLAGRLEHLLVSRGQSVPAGTPIFELESEDEAAAVRQADEQVNAAIAQLEDMKLGKRPPELDVVRAQLAQAVATERKSALQLKRDEEQYAIGGISEQQLDDSRAAETANAARVRELTSEVESSKLPARVDQIRAQTAQVAAARAALAQAQWRLGRKSVAATRSGLIFDTLFREGEWVPAGSPVVKMLPPVNVKVRFFVPEAALGSVRLGERVNIRCDGCKSAVAATVTYVSTESEYTPPVIYSNETRAKLTYMIEARPAAQDAPLLHPGQPVEVTLMGMP